jgi:hypothetical protein
MEAPARLAQQTFHQPTNHQPTKNETLTLQDPQQVLKPTAGLETQIRSHCLTGASKYATLTITTGSIHCTTALLTGEATSEAPGPGHTLENVLATNHQSPTTMT